MKELKEKAGLLSIMAALFVVKFVLVPVLEWQNDTLANISALEKRLYKINKVLADEKESAGNNTLLNAELQKIDQIFIPYQSEANLKLTQQKKIEDLIKEYNINLSNIGWQTITDIPELSIKRYSLQVVFAGKAESAVNFINRIESQPYFIGLSEITLTLRGQTKERLGQLRGKLVLEFFVENELTNAVEGGGTL